MARGGARVNAGRPKKAALAKPISVPADIKKAARLSGMTPLDYMLTVMNDAGADDLRRDRMAVAAAPFVHSKPSDSPVGKKEQAQEAAKTAGSGSEWGEDLRGPAFN